MDIPDTFTEPELVQAWLDNVLSKNKIEHVGAINRHIGRRRKLIDELGRRSAGQLTQLLPLLHHPDCNVVYLAAMELRSCDPERFRATMTALGQSGGAIAASAQRMLELPPLAPSQPMPPLPDDHPAFWSAHHPPPPAMSDRDIAALLSATVSREAERIQRLLVPAIGLWPQAERSDAPADGSRLGGRPHAPPGWSWPVAATEPMLFLGQINCAELAGLPGAEVLPSHGLLSLFGDHDSVMGCLLTGQGGAVYYWPDSADLAPAEPPIEILTVFPRAELLFRPQWDLPDPNSGALAAILRDGAQRTAYRELRDEVRGFGLPAGTGAFYSQNKLLGWPDLVQDEDFSLTLDEPVDQYRLLLQLGGYSNGREFADWGPGGLLYYFLTRDDFADRQWDNAELAGQFT